MISIVIPARNAAATIGAQLRALSEQPGIDICEVIVSDNASTDATAEIAQRWADLLPLRVVDASHRLGPAAARNIGARATSGELLLFVDADDVVLPGWLDTWRNIDPAVQFATGPMPTFGWAELPPAAAPTTAPGAPVHMGFLPYAFGGNFVIRRDPFTSCGGFPEDCRIGEDVVLSWRLQLDGATLAYRPEAAVARRRAPTPRAVLRQHFDYGRMDPFLYREFGPLGVPRPAIQPNVRTYLGLIARLPFLLDEHQRTRWLSQAGRRAGRLAGSWRERTWYP